jgi:hypothetical protein
MGPVSVGGRAGRRGPVTRRQLLVVGFNGWMVYETAA